MSLELMNLWRPIIDKPVNITKWMPLFTVDVLGKTVMSKSFDAMKGKEDRDLDNLSYMLNNLVRPSTFVVGLVGEINRKFQKRKLIVCSWKALSVEPYLLN
jgi:hypothetical protein